MLFLLIILFLLIGVYTWLSIVESGLSLLRLLPRMTLAKQALNLTMPLWGATNVLLISTLVCLPLYFGHSTLSAIHNVEHNVLLGLGLIVARSVCIIRFFAKKTKTGFRPLTVLFSLLTFAVPISFGLAAIRLTTGVPFWTSSLGWVLAIAMLLGLVALSFAFMYFIVGHTPHNRLHQLSSLLNVGFAIFLAVGLLLAGNGTSKHLHHLETTLFACLVMSIILVQGLLSLTKRDRYMWWYVSLFVIATPLLVALADRASLQLLR